jgi:hypothetical protein
VDHVLQVTRNVERRCDAALAVVTDLESETLTGQASDVGGRKRFIARSGAL